MHYSHGRRRGSVAHRRATQGAAYASLTGALLDGPMAVTGHAGSAAWQSLGLQPRWPQVGDPKRVEFGGPAPSSST
jgi:hypothetical protein